MDKKNAKQIRDVMERLVLQIAKHPKRKLLLVHPSDASYTTVLTLEDILLCLQDAVEEINNLTRPPKPTESFKLAHSHFERFDDKNESEAEQTKGDKVELTDEDEIKEDDFVLF